MRIALVGVLAMTLTGCPSVPTDAGRFNLDPKVVSHLRAPQTVALVNTYTSPTPVRLNSQGWSADLKDLTQTAAEMLRRAVEKQGITVAPQGDKRISLRILQARAGMGGGPMMSTAGVQLGVVLGNGTKFVVVGENVGFSGERALDGAVLFALNKLVADQRFVDYVNREANLHFVCLPQDSYAAGENLIVSERMVRIERIIGESVKCSSAGRPVSLEVRLLSGEEARNSFSHCASAATQPGDKLSIGVYASRAKTATVERIIGPSPRCDDPHRYPNRIEARFDE